MSFNTWDQIRELARLVTPVLPTRRTEYAATSIKLGRNKDAQVIRHALLGSDERVSVTELGARNSKDPKYKVVKTAARRRLINSCFNLSLRSAGYSTFFQESYKNDRLTFAAKILIALGARQTASLLTRSAFKESERLELANNALENAILLRQGCLLQGNASKHTHYTSRIDYWLGVRRSEIELEGIYDQLRIGYAKRAVPRQVDLERAMNGAEIARARMRSYPTFNVTLYSYRILTFRAQMQQDFRGCIELSEKAEAYIRSRQEFCNPVRIAEFAIKRLVCAVHLRDFNEGRAAGALCEHAYKAGTNNWYVYAENYFLLHTACERFAESRQVWKSITSAYNFHAQPEHRKNRWAIFGLYLDLVEGSLSSASLIPFSESLQFKELLSTVPTASIDKAGYNFALVVLHILYLIKERDWSAVIDRLDAIKSYKVRHLRSPTSQAAVFLQLLIQLEKHNFRYPSRSDRIELESALKHAQLDTSILEGLQIIPFEYLWDWVRNQIRPNSTNG